MKNIARKLFIATMCLTMAATAVLASVNNTPFAAETVQAAEKNGVYHEGNVWNYYVNGKQSNATTLCKYNGSWWYVHNGKIDFSSAKTLVKFNGSWWYVHDGKVDFSSRTLVKYNGVWWYVHDGRIDWNEETVVRYGNAWYHVKNGQVDWNSETLVKYNNEWWYVKDGTIRFGATTICKYNGTWWYVENGKVNFNPDGYHGDRWSTERGIDTPDSDDYGYAVCYYNNKYWLVYKGRVIFNKDTMHALDSKTYTEPINAYGVYCLTISYKRNDYDFYAEYPEDNNWTGGSFYMVRTRYDDAKSTLVGEP